MDPPQGCRPFKPCLLHHPHHHLHHHHHLHRLFLNPHHHCHHHHHHHHHHLLPNFTTFPQNPQHQSTLTHNPTPQVLQEQNHEAVVFHEEADDEEEDPVFVLTDEWKEFFAKSEAKRKLDRKQAKKGKK